MSNIIAIDPGPETCGVVIIKRDPSVEPGYLPVMVNAKYSITDTIRLLELARAPQRNVDHLVIEMVENYGRPTNRKIIWTCINIGQFMRAWGRDFTLTPRPNACQYFCGRRSKVTKAQVNSVIKDRYPQTGGGAEPALGTKKQPGPLYIMRGTSHAWDAFAVGLMYLETKQ